MKIPYTATTPDPEAAIVLEAGKKHGIDEAMVIYTSRIEVRDWVSMKYRHQCLAEGKSKCTESSSNPEEMRNVLKEYKRAILVAGKANTDDDVLKFSSALVEMERALFLKNHYKALAVVPDCCFPGKNSSSKPVCRPSIDCSGIDMISLARKIRKNIQSIEQMEKSDDIYGLILLD